MEAMGDGYNAGIYKVIFIFYLPFFFPFLVKFMLYFIGSFVSEETVDV